MFESPKWLINLLIVILGLIIPIVGVIVLIGYFFEMIEHMHRRGSDRSYPDFDFDRLTKYLVRGVWPFLAEFLMSLILLPVIAGGYLVMVFMWIFVAEKQFAPEIALGVTLAIVVVAVVLMVLVAIVRLPIYLKAGLQQEFGPAFSWGFFRDFYGRVGGTVILTLLFELVTAPILAFFGMLILCVGAYFAHALILYSQHHLLYQLYEEYLREGGTPIPLKPEDRSAKGDYGEEIVEDPGQYPE
jgi:hypothetical protein